MDQNIDCSSFILNVYKTFGFEFPRNTSVQKDSIGNIISLEGKTIKEKLEILSNSIYPSLLYKPGHVMLYIGRIENNYYIIHASGGEMKVIVTNLSVESSYLSDIDRIVTIP